VDWWLSVRSCALSIADATGARVHLPLPDVPEGVRSAVHGVREFRREDLRWTRGRPSTFVSSNVAERNFCNACGTPLTYHRVDSGSIAVTIGSLDDPEAARPIEQFGIESELSWTSGLGALPGKCTEDWMREYGIAHIDSHQSHVGSSG
jgi:hypothetical protein